MFAENMAAGSMAAGSMTITEVNNGAFLILFTFSDMFTNRWYDLASETLLFHALIISITDYSDFTVPTML